MRLELGDSSRRKETNWRSFESTLRVLVKAGALDPNTLQATALGQAAREVSALNELWMAMVLTHSSIQARPVDPECRSPNALTRLHGSTCIYVRLQQCCNKQDVISNS